MLAKLVLSFLSLAFVGYGAASLFFPDVPVGYIGYQLLGADARIEVAAMYGGLQLGLGIFFLVGVLSKSYEKPALLSVVLLLGGLGLSRGVSLLLASDSVTIYTHGALVFEIVSAVIAAYAFTRKNTADAG